MRPLILLAPLALAGMGSLPPQGFTCALAVTDGASTRVEARVASPAALSGTYSLWLRGPGLAIEQGGPFELPAGGSAVLGEATLPAGATLDGALTVTAQGRATACPLERS